MVTRSINPVIVTGMVLLAIVVLAAAYAAWSNIRSCEGPRERRLVVAITLTVWLLIVSLLILMYVTSPPGRYLLLIPYFLVLPWFVYHGSLRRQLLRKLEQRKEKGALAEAARNIEPVPDP